MSAAGDYDYEAALARVRRDREEGEKLSAERYKLYAEELKLRAEEFKLNAEERKLTRDHSYAPLVLASSILSAAITGLAVAFVVKFIH
jgi:hypothetical protein